MLPPAPPPPEEPGFVVGLDAIGSCLGYSGEAARRWIDQHGLPARRLPDGRWASSVRLIDSWLASYKEGEQP
jgi:hypothetical protein